ncbi:ABC transporter permease [Paenibacillus aurantius]|uniref:ABC transporter permease n=1 Tax=Paenibacillus aurantius TaxID=2918900 RepID=A0AA96LC81_9BACL|nr:ABC transporter permease [Paenibacillus aurantius]WNQ11304.1 ABC transporter permease [Paenibacillus aurantius]
MILRLLSVELLKIRRKMIWFLIVLGPLGVIGLQAVNFGVRYDYLVGKVYADDLWGGLINNVSNLMVPTLFIGIAIIASMAAGIEHQTNAWKQTLALPVTRGQVFTAKFLLSAVLLLVSSVLTALGTVLLGRILGFVSPVPYGDIAIAAFYPYLAVMPFLALQTWLSVIMANQALPLTAGILGMIFSMFSYRFEDWIPWKWPLLINAAGEPLYSVAAGLALGAIVWLLGCFHFTRKDVR